MSTDDQHNLTQTEHICCKCVITQYLASMMLRSKLLESDESCALRFEGGNVHPVSSKIICLCSNTRSNVPMH